MLAHHFRFMARYHRHATASLIASLEGRVWRGTESEQYSADSGLFFRSIHGTLNHLLGAEQLWFARLCESPSTADQGNVSELYALDGADMQAAWEGRVADRDELHRLVLAQCDAWVDLVERTDQSDGDDDWFAASATYMDTEGVPTSVVRAAALTQVFNHGTHHRGQITAAFSRAGQPCPSMDLQAMGDAFLQWGG